MSDDSRGLRCPHCNGVNFGVKDSRPSFHGWRRSRHCFDCKERFTTLEVAVPTPVPGRPLELPTDGYRERFYALRRAMLATIKEANEPRKGAMT